MDTFLTINEIAKSLKVERRTVIGWIVSGQLRAFKPGGGRFWRVRGRDLKRFVANSTASSKSAIE